MNIRILKTLLFLGFGVLVLATASTIYATHSWGGYHWARTANPFTLKAGDNLSSVWDPFLKTTTSDWSVSSVLDMNIVSAGSTNPRKCRPVSGRVEVCNSTYGKNGWLGIAQIWISGGHITQAITKMNDSYFNTAKYNTSAWRNLVLCQEVGHTVGLDHQDEDFNNPPLGTCMDYTSDPTPNQHPNQHDYDMLETIYAHLDSFTTIQSGTKKLPLGQSIAANAVNGDFENRSDWGKELKNNGAAALYERDLGNGNKLFTHVFLTQD